MYQHTLDPTRCPDCTQPHGGGGRCAHCALSLTGPAAAELWQVCSSIATLAIRRTALISVLRGQPVATVPDLRSPPAVTTPAAPTGRSPERDAGLSPQQRTEWTPRRVQNTLLGLGVLLLTIAALIFVVVTWGSLGIGVRATIMAAVTVAAASAAPAAVRRTLPSTAEAATALALLLLGLDFYAARASIPGLDRTDGLLYWAAATAATAAFAAGYAVLVPLRTPRVAAALAAQLPVALLALWVDDLALAALLLLAQSGLSASVAALRRQPHDPAAPVFRLGGMAIGVVGGGLAVALAFPSEPVDGDALVGAALLLLAGALSVLSGWLRRDHRLEVDLAGGRAGAAMIVAVVAVARLGVAAGSLPAVVAMTGACLVITALVLRDWQRGPLAVGAFAVGVALLVDGTHAIAGVVRPLAWLEDVWGLGDVQVAAAGAVPDGSVWSAPATVLLTLAAAAVTAAALGERTDHHHRGILTAGALLTVGGAVLPMTAGWTYAAAVSWTLALGVGLLAAAAVVGRSKPGYTLPLALPAAGLLATAIVWSLANQGTTVLVVGIASFALGAVALRRHLRVPAGTAAAALALGWAFAFARSREADVPASAFVVAATCAGLFAIGILLRSDGRSRRSLEATAAAAYACAVLLSVPDTSWCSGVLAVGVVTAAALALDPARRHAAAVSAALAATLAWTATAAFEGSVAQQGMAVALTGALLVGAGWLLRTGSGELIETIGAVAYAGGALAAVRDANALSIVLAAGGLTALAVALRPDRRQAAHAGAALLTGCLWVQLALAGIGTPEPYAIPPAVVAVVLGHLRRRTDEQVSSWAAYGPGLALALTPSLYVVPGDRGLARPLALGIGALAVLLYGARDRLQAPLVLGGATLALDALVQIAPLAAALPRWVSIGSVGLLLVVIGTTYEQRLRDVRRIQERFDALA